MQFIDVPIPKRRFLFILELKDFEGFLCIGELWNIVINFDLGEDYSWKKWLDVESHDI